MFKLVAEDGQGHDSDIVHFDFAEYQDDVLSLWIKSPDDTGAFVVANVTTDGEGWATILFADDPAKAAIHCRRVSVLDNPLTDAEATFAVRHLGMALLQKAFDESVDGTVTFTRQAIESYQDEPDTTEILTTLAPNGQDIVLRRTRVPSVGSN